MRTICMMVSAIVSTIAVTCFTGRPPSSTWELLVYAVPGGTLLMVFVFPLLPGCTPGCGTKHGKENAERP